MLLSRPVLHAYGRLEQALTMAIVKDLALFLRQYFSLDQLASEFIASIAIFAVIMLIAWVGHSLFKRYLFRLAARTATKLDDEILRNIRAPIFLSAFLVGAYYALSDLSVLAPYSSLLAASITIAEILVITFTITRIMNILVTWFAEQRSKKGLKVSNHILFVLKKSLQVVVYVFAFLTILVVFRIDLSGVVVGLGVGGIAIALALQNILGDAFSAFSIYFDRPFEIGDFIVVGDYAGTVTRIGLKSTRIQLLQGEELIISNRELTTASVRNFKALKQRRITFTVRVTCDTSVDTLKKIPDMLSKIVTGSEQAELLTVHFRKFGDYSFDFDVVYLMKTADYTEYLNTQQNINYAILEAFEKEGIKIAYPTQTVILGNKAD
jgi:small-conductance mechanosensitive channel